MSPRPAARRHPRQAAVEAGFSLIETVVALGVFSLVLSFLYASVWAGQRQLARIQESGEGAADLLGARRVIEQLVESATPTRPVRELAVPIFVGAADAMRFDALLDTGVSPPGLYRIALDVGRAAAPRHGYELTLTRSPLGPDAEDEAKARRAVLLTSDDKPDFVYRVYRPEGRRIVPVWVEDWPEPSRFPPAVGLRLGRDIVLIAAPRLDLDSRCVAREGEQGLFAQDCTLR